MPALLAGHIDTVVWMKKSWSVQIDDGCHTFVVGRHKESGDIKLVAANYCSIGSERERGK